MQLLQQNPVGSKVQSCSPGVRTKSTCKSCHTASARPLSSVGETRHSEDVSMAPSTSSCSFASSRSSRRNVLAGLVMGTTASSLLSPQVPVTQAAPFLESTGAKGPLATEEERLYRLRQEREGEARKALQEERERLERESRETMEGKLCATPFGVDVVGITELFALVGAVVGGVSARQRKEELERLNEQLRKINLSLRQQARAGTLYAPGLTYAPPVGSTSAVDTSGGGAAAATATLPATPIIMPKAKPAASSTMAPSAAATAAAPTAAPFAGPAAQPNYSTMSLEEDEMSAEQLQCRDALRAGKRLLKENGAAAMIRFEKALMLSKQLGDKVQERRAMRGLAASARIQGQYKSAIKHLERVLEISQEFKEFTGDADAYGTIADCYTDMGDFDKAAAYYDKYIDTMNREGPV
ncbi:FLU chloroplast precursor, alternative spliced version s-FLP [Dunaliella salina]|uniref:FLU chloroplast, alternative spliced version s-FLP n=1 Tax=Dunaliella salina TaxID=3046 RepID=A0ABQ7GIZ8_DUNSA|nr:FLU chloroplast precursor, alternative spliced version s-FLP [Dunaliella salina]|eukprot:KAF5834578.1 FLU chloroplast precursor, alternative spliced version s-FLP [Dunaliella salina]